MSNRSIWHNKHYNFYLYFYNNQHKNKISLSTATICHRPSMKKIIFNAKLKHRLLACFYKSKYITCDADKAPKKLKALATDTTAVVVPEYVTIVPIHIDKMNCAKNTILLTIAMSVPNPRTWPPIDERPSGSTWN